MCVRVCIWILAGMDGTLCSWTCSASSAEAPAVCFNAWILIVLVSLLYYIGVYAHMYVRCAVLVGAILMKLCDETQCNISQYSVRMYVHMYVCALILLKLMCLISYVYGVYIRTYILYFPILYTLYILYILYICMYVCAFVHVPRWTSKGATHPGYIQCTVLHQCLATLVCAMMYLTSCLTLLL